ncbi:MAG: MFS transporter, partial [Pseudonocardiaceae bacterium]
LGLLVAAIALIALFVAIEARSAHPLISLRIFRIASLRNGNGLTLLMTGAMLPMFFVLTLYLQNVLNFTPIQAGLAQVPAALAFALLGTPISQLVNRIGYRIPAAAGGMIAGAGIFWLSRFEADGTYLADILVPMTLAALGGALGFISLMIAATSDAPLSDAGVASGLVNATQQIGGAIGLASLSTIAASSTNRASDNGDAPLSALATGLGSGLVVAAVTAVAAGLLSAALLRKKRSSDTDASGALSARAEWHILDGIEAGGKHRADDTEREDASVEPASAPVSPRHRENRLGRLSRK